MNLNFEQLHLFIEGMKISKEQHAEEKQSYEYGLNGRLYSKNGKLSFSSIKGTVQIYNNPKIIKYLGYFSFADELVLFIKYDENYIPQYDSSTTSIVEAENIVIDIPYGTNTFTFTNELTANATDTPITITAPVDQKPASPLIDNYQEVISIKTIDLSTYYSLGNTNIANYEICDLGGIDDVPEYNKTYADAIIVLKTDGYKAFFDRVVWKGNMNWDINRKITTVGVFENAYYKRVYFTDNLNPLRVVNLKDNSLSYRQASEFDIRQNTTLLQPTIESIDDTGSIKAMTVQYAFRLMTENGQVTHFSPYSKQVHIVKDSDGYDFAGGGVEEVTSKSVTIHCPVIDTNYNEIQAIAIEFAADTIPTAIRNLGVKSVAEIVEFIHTGNEAEFSDNLTLEDIIETKNIWTYCNDITTKNNKLIAAGLRNEPYGLQEKYIEDLFLFKGFDVAGLTHNSLINPTPSVYRYFDPENQDEAIYLNKQLYLRFLFFGNCTLTLKNKNDANADQSISFVNSSDKYLEYIDEIWLWLEELQNNGSLVAFPNLIVSRSDSSILFDTIAALQTDLSDYYFTTSISQVIIDFQNEFGLLVPAVDTNKLIYGAQSVGFNKGVGVRMSFKEVKDAVLNKSSELYTDGKILDLETPSLKKTFVKNEIYRMSIQFFSKGNPLFAIVCGDVQTPAIGEPQKYINSNSEAVVTIIPYRSQSVDSTILYAHRIEAEIEVRIPCELKNSVDSYQIQYVERTENNRTVLAQGLAAPLIRMAGFYLPSLSGEKYAPDVYNKWTLPFTGGPLYSVNGLKTYDELGENFNDIDSAMPFAERNFHREVVNRKVIYFDSPDLSIGRISAKKIGTGRIQVVGRLNTDHTPHLIRSRFPDDENHTHYLYTEDETYKDLSFSRKLGYSNIAGAETHKPYTVNISLFSKFTLINEEHIIENASNILAKGQIVPGAEFSTAFEVINAAHTMFHQNAYNSSLWGSEEKSKTDQIASESGQSSNKSEGYPTIILRGETEIFNDNLVGDHITNPIFSMGHTGEAQRHTWDQNKVPTTKGIPNTDSHALVNIKMNNEASIYGGRSKYAFSQNVFIPLGAVIPIKGSTGSNQSQKFTIEGDFYVSLYLRTKNDWSNPYEIWDSVKKMHQDDDKQDDWTINDYNRGGAWAYGVVLETEVESRFASEYRYYRAAGSIDFSIPILEIINSAYFKKNNLRIYSPVPYNFKDDPLMTNILSASKTKLSGDYYDAWTEFLLNEFYELDKAKGIITNITSWKDTLFAIQELETNQVNIDTTNFITTDEGENVAINKGDGKTFTSHKKVSDFGTAIRRALCEGEFGFSFMDEKNKAFVQFGKPLSLELEIQQKLHSLFEYDKIVDTEGYYDVKYKETNIRVRTESGKAYMLSYNELLRKFNGWIAYDNDIYIVFDKRVFAPTCSIRKITTYCPEITSDNSISVQAGVYFTYQIEATNTPIAYNAIDLPDFLQINNKTGLIYGTVEVAGTYPVRINAENTACSDTLEINIYILPVALIGTINGKATVTGTLFVYAISQISGESNGKTTTYVKISGPGNLEGVINGKATVYIDIPIAGVINGSATTDGELRGLMSLCATGGLYFENTIYLRKIIGSSNSSATVTAEIIPKFLIQGVSNGVAFAQINNITPSTEYIEGVIEPSANIYFVNKSSTGQAITPQSLNIHGWGQSFTQSNIGIVNTFSLLAKKITGTPGIYNFQCTIYPLIGFTPDLASPLEVSNTIDADTVSDVDYEWITFTFPGTYYDFPIAIIGKITDYVGNGYLMMKYGANVDPNGQFHYIQNDVIKGFGSNDAICALNIEDVDLGTLGSTYDLGIQDVLIAEVSTVLRYDAETFERKVLSIPAFSGSYDIAHTANKLWNVKYPVDTGGGVFETSVDEYDITLAPFLATFNRTITLSGFYGPGLCAIDDTTLISSLRNTENGSGGATKIQSIDITTTPVPTDKVTLDFSSGVTHETVLGDILLSDTAKVMLLTMNFLNNKAYLSQYDWATGVQEIKVEITATANLAYGLAVQNSKLFIFDGAPHTPVYQVALTSPYGLTLTDTMSGIETNGASQVPGYVNVELIP